MKQSPIPDWRNQKNISLPLGQVGTIVIVTVIRVVPEGFGALSPYAVGIIELDTGVRTIGQIVDAVPESLTSGQRVQAVLRKMPSEDREGIIHYTLKFICIS